MKTAASIVATIALSLLASAAYSADSGERTTMPNACSDRNANCVIQDGPPRQRGGEPASTAAPTRPGAGDKSGASAPGSKAGGARAGDGGSSR